MKRLLSFLFVAVFISLAGPIACVATGCKTHQAQAATYHTLRATALAGQAAIDAAALLRVEGKLSEQRWRMIAQHYDHTFQPALRLAIAAAQGDVLASPPPSLLGELARLQALAAP